MKEKPLLIIFSGLPGVGKTTIAMETARELAAVYLRIDSLEMGLLRSGLFGNQWDIGPAGYYAAYALALDNLRNGMRVVADSVNPLKITRDAWRDVALQAQCPYLEIEIICSDTLEHKSRVENRRGDIAGHLPPTWSHVLGREYEPWDRVCLVLDSSKLSPLEAVSFIVQRAGEALSPRPARA